MIQQMQKLKTAKKANTCPHTRYREEGEHLPTPDSVPRCEHRLLAEHRLLPPRGQTPAVTPTAAHLRLRLTGWPAGPRHGRRARRGAASP